MYNFFSMYDVDGNGWIDLVEMTRIVKSIYNMMGPNQVAMDKYESPEARAEGIFKRMDVNKDGKVTRQEFVRCCLEDQRKIINNDQKKSFSITCLRVLCKTQQVCLVLNPTWSGFFYRLLNRIYHYLDVTTGSISQRSVVTKGFLNPSHNRESHQK